MYFGERVVWRLILLFLLIFVFNVNAEQLAIEITAEPYQIITLSDGSHEIRMQNFGNLLTPGKPMLPGKTFLIAVPPDAEIRSVHVQEIESTELEGKFRISPAPLLLPMNEDLKLIKEAEIEYQKNFQQVYSLDQFYPEKIGWYSGEGRLRKFQFVKVTFSPFSYNPISQKLVLHSKILVNIEYLTNFSDSDKILRDKIAINKASKLLFNYDQVKQFYSDDFYSPKMSQSYNYVIITTNELENSVASFVSWKQSIGYSVNVVTTDWINSQYNGSDLQERIRNFLIDKYGEWGIEYVLLVGDVNDVPMRLCYPKANSSSNATSTDYYYADLTGDWNSDGDSRYGEHGQDNVDWVPEVIVGRIPWSNPSTVSSICDKLENFERNRGAWKKNGLLLGAMSNYTNEDHKGYAKTDGASLMELHKNLIANAGGSSATMYEKSGIDPSSYSCTIPLTHANIIDEWSNNRYGMVNWWAHGSKTAAYRKYWSSDDGN